MENKQILLVEGLDDYNVIDKLRLLCTNPESFTIERANGIDELRKGLPLRLKGSGETKTIGVVIDADVNIEARWQSIYNILIKSNLYTAIPKKCPEKGLILSPNGPDDIKFGLWIMPDNKASGMLENFTTLLVPEDDELLPIVDRTLTEIEEGNLNKYALVHHEKARIHTWLAWQEEPGTPMGSAITKKYLSTTSPVCQDFIQWLNALYN